MQPSLGGRAGRRRGETAGQHSLLMAALLLLIALMASLAEASDAYMLGDGPDPLFGTGYSPEHGNFLCAPFFGENVTGDTYELPCKAPSEEWDSTFLRDEFVITAWWPPTMNVIHQYAAAGFNLVMGGNIRHGCQLNGSLPSPATATQAFGCFLEQLPLIESLGLKVAYADGGYNHTTTALDQIQGGDLAMGGVTDATNFSRPVYPTAPEVAWVVDQLERKNISHVVVQYFLHDDVVANNQAINDAVDFLKATKPSIVPQTNTGNQGYDTLYQDRQPTFVPEEYAIDGSITEATREMAVDAELALFESNQYIAQRYRLTPWPLFALGDGGGVHNLASASLVRVQVYSALAYGMKGLYYYCWGNGIWNVSGPGANTGGVPGTPTPNYNVVKAINRDAAKYGKMLLKTEHLGAIRNPASPLSRALSPGQNLPITAMDTSLLVGVLQNSAGGAYLMIVDTRTAVRNKTLGISGDLPVRAAKLSLHPGCNTGVALVPGGEGGYEQRHAASHTVSGSAVTLSLEAGSGTLLQLAPSPTCEALLANVRQWRFHPRTLSERGGSEIQLSGKSAAYSRFGAARRHFAPGGPAGWESNFLLGGAYTGGFQSEHDAVTFSQAGFSIVAVAEAHLMTALRYAAAYGNFVFAAPGNLSLTAADAARIADRYSCHTNLLGMVVANSGAAALASATPTTTAMKRAANWLFPLVANVESVGAALALAEAGIAPLAAVSLPAVPAHVPSSPSAASASGWGQATLTLLGELSTALANRSVMATMAVTVDVCSYESESIHRATMYWPVIFGAQALWLHGVDRCAPIGSDKFKLLAETNKRLTQWAEPLFMKGASTPAWNGVPRRNSGPPGSTASSDCRHGGDCFSELLRYNVTHVFSTSSLTIPNVQGVAATKPGGAPADLVQSMDSELVVLVLRNATVEVGNSEAGVEFQFANQRYLLIMSTELSTVKGGAPLREVAVQLRADVTSTKPIEPDGFQGFASVPGSTANSYSPTPEQGIPPTFRGDRDCPLSWLGSQMGSTVGSGQLRLPGGSVQLLTYTLQSDWAWPRPGGEGGDGAEDQEAWRNQVGRRSPKKVGV